MAIPAAISAKNLSIILLLVIFTIISGPLANAGDHHQLGWLPSGSACTGSIAECLAGDEFSMDSEINRRILATSQYISYQALRRNSVPCSRRGASYYNCRPGAQANPYRRGCSAITRCRN
ncbi:protein RALF-like 1 [Magnolia sinica]|uniref:protein RALF-like 1 n=1 Tax=Magnolia sinica TaxID=86752 RepID=UPI002657F448|nr:protein RALF-like 1 [Magnolia sinica]